MTWGENGVGVPAVPVPDALRTRVERMGDRVVKIKSTRRAFSAVTKHGYWFTWGDEDAHWDGLAPCYRNPQGSWTLSNPEAAKLAPVPEALRADLGYETEFFESNMR